MDCHNVLFIIYIMYDPYFDKCLRISKSDMLKELEKLRNQTSEGYLVNIINDEMRSIREASGSPMSMKRMRGGSSKFCHAMTLAIIIGGAAGSAIALYHYAFPIMSRGLPELCKSRTDQVTGALLSWIQPSASCLARQEAWDSFRRALLLKSGIPATAGIGYMMKRYKEIHEQVLPYCDMLVSGVCKIVKAPFSRRAKLQAEREEEREEDEEEMQAPEEEMEEMEELEREDEEDDEDEMQAPEEELEELEMEESMMPPESKRARVGGAKRKSRRAAKKQSKKAKRTGGKKTMRKYKKSSVAHKKGGRKSMKGKRHSKAKRMTRKHTRK